MENVRISVIMGVCNGAETLERALNSIIEQTYDRWELILCDDGSTDRSYQIMLATARKFPDRVKVIRNRKNRGLAYSLNRCLKYAGCEYIARMDADDVSLRDRFAKQAAFLDEHSQYALVGSQVQRFDEKGKWGRPGNAREVTIRDILALRAFTHPSVMIRRSVLLQVGGYTAAPITDRAQDIDLWCKIYSHHEKGYITAETLLEYYDSRDQTKEVTYIHKKRLCRLLLYWRKQLHLPWWYNYYGWRALGKLFIPERLRVFYKKVTN